MTNQTIRQLFDLTGKVGIVTGGARGIGQAIAFRLAEGGASVLVSDINLEGSKETVGHITSKGGKAKALYADARVASDARKVTREAVNAFGRLDILVNNAGIFPVSAVLQTNEETWDSVLDTNLKGMFFYSQAASQEMIKAGRGGRIINIASYEAFRPYPGFPHYDASKGGVVSLTRNLALELGPHNILVNAVAPGGVKTPGTEQMMMGAAQAAKISLDQFWDRAAAQLPVRRMGEPDDIATVVYFLASAAAGYMNGSVVLVDGGGLLV